MSLIKKTSTCLAIIKRQDEILSIATKRISYMPELAEVYYYAKQWNVGHGKQVQRVHINTLARVYRDNDVSELADKLT